MIEDFIEHSDRYEKEFKVGGNGVVVCIYKDEISNESEIILGFVLNDLVKILNDSLAYIGERKSEYDIAFINDFSDPQIFVGRDHFSVYWDSETGRNIGVTVIAADYYWPGNKWQGLTIGD